VRAFFDALCEAEVRLNKIAYSEFLRLGELDWGQSRGLGTTHSPFHIYDERFDRAFTLGSWVCPKTSRHISIIFSVVIAWTEDAWFIQSSVEEEDPEREETTKSLWHSSAYRTSLVTEAMVMLDQSLRDLETSLSREPVASYLVASVNED
jgi:hypothetical protein